MGRYFTPSHEWIDASGTVGITAFAQKELGEIVFVQLPKIGSALKMGEEACVLESTKAAADVYAPVSGKVIAVNSELSLLNKSPESAGWLFKLTLDNPAELKGLMTQEEYQTSIQE